MLIDPLRLKNWGALNDPDLFFFSFPNFVQSPISSIDQPPWYAQWSVELNLCVFVNFYFQYDRRPYWLLPESWLKYMYSLFTLCQLTILLFTIWWKFRYHSITFLGFLMFKVLFKFLVPLNSVLESRLNSRAIFRDTHTTPLLSSNLKFSLPAYLEQCLGYLNVCKGMKSCLYESGLFRIKEAPCLSRILLIVSGSAEWVNQQHYIQQNIKLMNYLEDNGP